MLIKVSKVGEVILNRPPVYRNAHIFHHDVLLDYINGG
jgi:hypothetical protein